MAYCTPGPYNTFPDDAPTEPEPEAEAGAEAEGEKETEPEPEAEPAGDKDEKAAA